MDKHLAPILKALRDEIATIGQFQAEPSTISITGLPATDYSNSVATVRVNFKPAYWQVKVNE